jgi:PPOX class probable F420-dependent enzyme
MTDAEWKAFVRQGTRTGKLAITLASGRPTVTPVWFVLEDDGKLRITTGIDSPKAKSLARDPRACLLVDLEEPPYGFVRIDCTARLDSDPTERLRVATAVGGRYMGAQRAAEFGQRNGGDDEVVVEFTPLRVVAIGGMAE